MNTSSKPLILTPSLIGGTVLSKASEFVGLVETRSNARWSGKTDKIVEWMGSVGWQPGWPYCIAACEAVYKWAYSYLGIREVYDASLASVLSPHVMSSYRVALARKLLKLRPIPGAIALWSVNSARDTGHAGVVEAVDGLVLKTIEANTSSGKGDQREGDGFFRKLRSFALNEKRNGLTLLGFIHPVAP